jgi:hypothetical protein
VAGDQTIRVATMNSPLNLTKIVAAQPEELTRLSPR